MSAYAELQSSSRSDLAGKTRVMVQVGHCSQAVGAAEVAETLRVALTGHPVARLVVAGCDGACFAAPQVIVAYPSGETRRFLRVTQADIPALVETLASGAGPGDQPPADPPMGPDGWRDWESFFSHQRRLVLARCGRTDPGDINEYLAAGGYGALDAALGQRPEAVIQAVLDAGLLGRGGAYFPAARKWQAARSAKGTPRYLVVNAEEGEPGLFKDRHIMEGDPHLLLEGMLIAAYAAGALHGYLYINAEANLSARRMEAAIEQARQAGLVGANILGSGFDFEISVRRGAGGYVCGEETTLLDTIQGNRREPRLRPPFPTEAGLFQKPTVINNVETLANVPIVLSGSNQTSRGRPGPPPEGPPAAGEIPPPPAASEASLGLPVGNGGFSDSGLESARGTKLICLSGSVRRPGLAEVPMGATLRQVIYAIGGGPPPGHRLGVMAVGGPSSGLLPPAELDMALRPGLLHPSGVVMGAGGITVIDDTVAAIDVARRLAAYNAAESCGKCTPCREGTPRMVEALERLASGGGSADDLEELRYLAEIVGAASLCGLGQMAGGPINSTLHFFSKELERLAGV